MAPPHTERLTAERLRQSHLAELCRMHRDARVMATLGGVRPDAETQRFLASNLEHWRRHGYGLFVFRERASGGFVGRAGLRHVALEGGDEVELAYALMPPFWGRGLASEMAAALLRFGFEEIGLTEIVGFTLTTNAASRRVLENAGFGFERALLYAGLPHVLYRIGRVVHPSRGCEHGS